jgi:formamidopyrimidine-DNA glycosylase
VAKLTSEGQQIKTRNQLNAYNRTMRSCVDCGEKIGDRPYVNPHSGILHEACWNKKFI